MLSKRLRQFGATDYVARQFTLHYGAVQAGEPRQASKKVACRRLGRRLAHWILVFIDGRKDLLSVHQKLELLDLLRHPAKAISPELSKMMVAGSGTGAT